ncbi:molybdopterin-dependent oxidoreductase [Roseovarius arcticus]|uniref:molybdopterin-dependent oxidoreductase n=1 Tax=Roseovarius arcticus TaxID=2547404 RepID=UPI0011101782|nr:molybdopterin-dependent oxidoreductase [Roseovarius arcticus]
MREKLLHLARNTLAMLFLALPTVSYAEGLLTVTTDGASESLSLDDLLAMPQSTVITKNDYVDDTTEFSGPALKDLLVRYDIGPDETLTLRAINDFSVSVPAADAYQYNVILALFSNGEKLTTRDKGPIWVIYPMSDHEELRDDSYNSRIIWQLTSITAE